MRCFVSSNVFVIFFVSDKFIHPFFSGLVYPSIITTYFGQGYISLIISTVFNNKSGQRYMNIGNYYNQCLKDLIIFGIIRSYSGSLSEFMNTEERFTWLGL